MRVRYIILCRLKRNADRCLCSFQIKDAFFFLDEGDDDDDVKMSARSNNI